MPLSMRSAKSVCRVSGCVPGSVCAQAAQTYSRVEAAAVLTLKDYFERELNCARRASLAEGAEVRIHLAALNVEPGGREQVGKLSMVPGIEQLRSELDVARLRKQ